MVSRRPGRARGYTLIELMVTLGVIATITAIGLPAAKDIIMKQRVRSASTDLVNSLVRARSFAIKLQRNVTLTPVDADNWEKGWTVANPGTGGGNLDAREAVKQVAISGPASVVFRSNGRPTASDVAFGVTADGVTDVRCVKLDLSGLPDITKVAC